MNSELETKMTAALGGIVSIQQAIMGLREHDTIGARIMKSEQLAAFKSNRSDLMTLPLTQREVKSAVISTGAANDPLAPAFKPQADTGARRTRFVRDLLPEFGTENGAIEMPVKDSATNNAGVQTTGSPLTRENVALGESAAAWTNSFIAVETIGHWIPVANQILEDSGTLDATINNELLYGLALAVENQVINGTGTAGQLHGLLSNATAWTNESPNITNEVDVIRSACKQIELADFAPSAVLLNPLDWYSIETRKSGSGDDAYVAGPPRLMDAARLWSIPVLPSNSIASGTFLVGDFNRAAVLFNRQQAAVQIARHDDSNFQKNMLTLRAVERLALVVTNPLALVTGSL